MVKAKLLVVDDERVLLELMTRRLEKLSYEVKTATSGVRALEILQSQEIDVLVTDFKMPGMTGYELIARAIKIDPMLQSVVVTGYSDLKTAIDVMGAGAFNYLSKPVDFNELDVSIQKGLERRHLLQDIQNKQKQLEEYRQHLEKLVEKRTSALTTTNKALEKEIEERKQLEVCLREAKVLAENANKAKSEFLANMSHEIRTPMTSAIGLLNLVLDTELLPKQKTYLEMARVSTVVMHNLLNDILDFSKIEAGKLTLESIAFDPRKVINSVVDLQHLQAEEKNIRITTSIDSDVPASVVGDPNRFRQIILNLVSNALKFTHYGEVVVSCKNAEDNSDNTSLNGNNQLLNISVKDSGIGIDKAKIRDIFEAFTQADSSTTREYGGVGLGLNISSKLVAMMGGKLWAVSEPGQGSTFHFTCNFGKVRIREKKTKRPGAEKIPEFPQLRVKETLTILLVEDNQSNQWVFRELLMQQGYKVFNVSDGASALRELENRQFDMMLLDLQLPEMNGYEVVHTIRSYEKQSGVRDGQHLPIVAMTGANGENEKQKCLDAGMDDFIAKPFTAGQLFAKILKNFREKSNASQDELKGKEKKVMNSSLLTGEIFNENAALQKASGDREIMVQRLKNFVQTTPQSLEMVHKYIEADDSTLLVQEVHHLHELAMEVGATNFGDELFSLLMSLRRKQVVEMGQMSTMKNEFEDLCNELRVQTLLGD